jgi:hypothetical protein
MVYLDGLTSVAEAGVFIGVAEAGVFIGSLTQV